MTKPTNFEEKIGFEDMFTTVRNNEGKEIFPLINFSKDHYLQKFYQI